MDINGKTAADISSGDNNKKTSIIESSTEEKIRNLEDIQEFANKISSLKDSLLQGDVCTSRQSLPEKSSCIVNVNSADGSGEQNGLKVCSAIGPNTTLCSGNLSDGPKVPNGDTLPDSIIKSHNVNKEKESGKDCNKVGGEMKNQTVEDEPGKESVPVSGLGGNKSTSDIYSEFSEMLKGSSVNAKKEPTTGKLSNAKELDRELEAETIVDNSVSISAVATSRTHLSDSGIRHTDDSVLGEILSVTEVENVEIVVDDNACGIENDAASEKTDNAEDLNSVIKNVKAIVTESSFNRTVTPASSTYASSNKTNEHCQNAIKYEDSDARKEATNLSTGELVDKMEVVRDDHFSHSDADKGCKDDQNNNRSYTDDTEGSQIDNSVVEKRSLEIEEEVIVVDDSCSGGEIDVVNVESIKGLPGTEKNVQSESSDKGNKKLINAKSPESRIESMEIECSESIEVINGRSESKVTDDSTSNNVEKKADENIDAPGCDDENDKAKETNNSLPLAVNQRGRRSSASKSAPTRYSPPPMAYPPKPKRGRGRSSDNLEITADVLLPFKLGWLREVVERATCSSAKRMWDVYYRSPDGTKLRSMPDVMNYLNQHPESALSHQNFTFYKTHIYREPFEVRRKAKVRVAGNQENSPKTPKNENKTPKKENCRPQKNKNDKTPSQENSFQTKSTSHDQDGPEVVVCDDVEPPMKKPKLNSGKKGSSTEETSVLQTVKEDTNKYPTSSVQKELHSHPSKQRKNTGVTRFRRPKAIGDNSATLKFCENLKLNSSNSGNFIAETAIRQTMKEDTNKYPVSSIQKEYRVNPPRQEKSTCATKFQHRKATGDFNAALSIYEKVHMKLVKPLSDYSRSSHKLDGATGKDVTDSEKRKKQGDAEVNAASKKEVTLASQINNKIKRVTVKLSMKDKTKRTNKSSDDLSGVDVNLCSNRCPGSFGEIPSLQCIICLCLFHPKCMGLHRASSSFICKRCEAIRSNREVSQDKHQKTKAEPSSDSSLQQNDSEFSDEDNATNVSVLTPEVLIQHDGSDHEEIPPPRMLSYSSFPNSSTTSTVSSSSQYNNATTNNRNNVVRPVPPLKPIPTLTPAPQLTNQLLASKRIVAASTFFPPSVSESYNTYSGFASAINTGPRISSINSSCPPLIGIPPLGSSVRLIAPQQLPGTVQTPALVQGFNTGPPPLRLVSSNNIPTNVSTGNRIALPNNSGSCLVLQAPGNIFRPGTTTQLIGPFPSNSLPQFMLVNNKVVCVNPAANQQLPEQKGNSVPTNVSVTQSLTTSTSKCGMTETRKVCPSAEQNNPYLAALLSSKGTVSCTENVNIVSGNVSSSSANSPTMTVVDGKLPSTTTPKLTAVIPPSFSVLRSSSLQQCASTQVTTSAVYSLTTASTISENRTSSESPSSNESSFTENSSLAKHLEATIKLCLSATQTSSLNDPASPVLLNTNINKRLATSTTPAIKSPMTTARLLKGTESSLAPPRSVSLNKKCYTSSEVNEKKKKLDVSLSLSSLSSSSSSSRGSQQNCDSPENSSMKAVQNTAVKHTNSSHAFELICDQSFRTTAFTSTSTSLLNTMTECYNCLNNIFQYLSTIDLLRAKLVCKSWYRLASQQFLWKKVSLKKLVIADWKKFAFALDSHGTTHLDLRGHGLLHSTWPCFVSVLNRLDKIRHIECGLIPAFVLYAMASKLVELKSLSGECAMFSHWTTGKVGPCVINFNLLENFREMEKFQLRCQEGLMSTVVGGLSPLSHLSKLRHLSITTLENIDCEQFKFLKKLSNLETLEIGDCSNWTPEIYSYVGKMVELKTLRLEKGGESDGLVDALSNLKRLKELNLVIYKIPALLEEALKGLINLKLLSIWPDTTTNSSFQNYKAMHAVRSLHQLQELRWVILSDTCYADGEVSPDEEGTWRNKLEDYKECQIDFSDPVSDTPLMSHAELKGVVKSLPLKDFITIKGLSEGLQEALPSTKIKIFQVPLKQLRKYSAFQ